MHTDNLLGVVLCGGESKRMGRDKGLLKQKDKTWSQLVAEKLEGINIPVIISINPVQQEAYSKIFDASRLITDALPMRGPLNGLLTVHRRFPNKDILLMACDIIDMRENVLLHLAESYCKDETADFFAYEEAGFFQPLCAIYKATALKNLDTQFINGTLVNYSFQHILKNGKTHCLKSTSASAFTNYNTQQP